MTEAYPLRIAVARRLGGARGLLFLLVVACGSAIGNPILNAPTYGLDSGHQLARDIALAADLIRKNEFDRALAVAAEIIKAMPDDPAGYSLQGTAYLGKKDWASARKSFEKALSVRPDDATAIANLAHIDIQQKDPASARKRFQAMLAKDRNNVSAMLGMAQLEFQRNDDKAALAWIQKAKTAQPAATDPWLNVAAYYMRRGRFAEAVAELSQATTVNPRDADLLNLLGQAQMANGQNTAAAATFQRLVNARPDAPLGFYRLATAQLAANDPTGAKDSLTKALGLKPDFVDALVMLAAIEARAKRYAEALKLAQQLKQLQPGSPIGLVLEGDIAMAQERYAEAAKAYESAFSAGPSGATAIKVHAAQVKAGRAKEAEAGLRRWLKEHPEDVGAMLYAAAESLRTDQPKAAVNYYQQVLRKDPRNVLALNNLASLYQRDGDTRALSVAESAYKLDPESAVVSDTLGWILVSQGKDASRGIRLLEAAATKEPANLEIRYHLAAARAKAGDKARARRELEAMLASGQPFAQREAAQALLKQL